MWSKASPVQRLLVESTDSLQTVLTEASFLH